MASEPICVFNCSYTNGRVLPFTEKKLNRCREILNIRTALNLKYSDVILPADSSNTYGHHAICYKYFTSMQQKYVLRYNAMTCKDEAGEIAKKKWKNLRDSYVKELKKIRKPRFGTDADNDEDYKGKWPYVESMSFVKIMLRPRKNEGNILSEDPIQSNSLDLPTSTKASMEDELDSVRVPNGAERLHVNMADSHIIPFQDTAHGSRVTPQKRPSTTRPRRRGKRKNNDLKAFLNIQQENNDDDLLWFKSILPYVKQLPSLNKLHFRTQVQESLRTELSKIKTLHPDSQLGSRDPAPENNQREIPEIMESSDDVEENHDKDYPEYFDLPTTDETRNMDDVDIKIEDSSIEMGNSEHELSKQDPLCISSVVKIKTEPSHDQSCDSDAVKLKTEPSHDPPSSSSSEIKIQPKTGKEEYTEIKIDGMNGENSF